MALQAGSSNCDMYIFKFMVCAPAHHQKSGFLSTVHRSASGLGNLHLWSPMRLFQDTCMSVGLAELLFSPSTRGHHTLNQGNTIVLFNFGKILRHQRGRSIHFVLLMYFLISEVDFCF